MTIEEEKKFRDLIQQVRDLKSAMCCYDEMLLLLDLSSELWRHGTSGSEAISRIDRFEIERLVKTRLPDVLKTAKRARLMRHSDPYWPENYVMSLLSQPENMAAFTDPKLGEKWKE